MARVEAHAAQTRDASLVSAVAIAPQSRPNVGELALTPKPTEITVANVAKRANRDRSAPMGFVRHPVLQNKQNAKVAV